MIAQSFRDWGRDCYCEPGKENTCGIRFDRKMGKLSKGYGIHNLDIARGLVTNVKSK